MTVLLMLAMLMLLTKNIILPLSTGVIVVTSDNVEIVDITLFLDSAEAIKNKNAIRCILNFPSTFGCESETP